jgi:dUTP pyrophosphatase
MDGGEPRPADVPVVRCTGTAHALPEYQSDGAAGADLRARLAEPIVLRPGQRALVPTGLHMEIPPGYEGQVRPRSGLAVKHGVTVLNSPGTIDSDYRGEVKVPVINLGQEEFTINDGDRIAQIIISPVSRAAFRRVDAVSETGRGGGGFGSTGT